MRSIIITTLMKRISSVWAVVLFLCGPSFSISNVYARPLVEMIATDDGIGPLTIRTLFSEDSIKKIFHDFDVSLTKSMLYSEGIAFPAIQVKKGQAELFTIYSRADSQASEPAPIFGVVSKSPLIRGPQRVKVGDRFAKVFRGAQEKCVPGMEEISGYIVCLAPKSQRLYYVFSASENSALPDGVLPPRKDLLKSKIVMLVWGGVLWGDIDAQLRQISQ